MIGALETVHKARISFSKPHDRILGIARPLLCILSEAIRSSDCCRRAFQMLSHLRASMQLNLPFLDAHDRQDTAVLGFLGCSTERPENTLVPPVGKYRSTRESIFGSSGQMMIVGVRRSRPGGQVRVGRPRRRVLSAPYARDPYACQPITLILPHADRQALCDRLLGKIGGLRAFVPVIPHNHGTSLSLAVLICSTVPRSSVSPTVRPSQAAGIPE